MPLKAAQKDKETANNKSEDLNMKENGIEKGVLKWEEVNKGMMTWPSFRLVAMRSSTLTAVTADEELNTCSV